MLDSKVCKILNIKYPILQGGMAWVATAELASAVSNSGALGIIGAGNAPPDFVRSEIIKTKKMTNKPFGVNVYYMSPYVNDIIDIIIEEKVPVITTGAGNPGKDIEKLKKAGTKVIPVVASVALAKRLARLDVDAIIAEGIECGGHVGEITTMTLVPQVVNAVDIPVIAAGGIATGKSLAAALILGADAVQIGTRFVCSNECNVHENYKQAIIKAKDRDTVLTGRSTGHPVRIIKNKLSKEFDKMEKNGSTVEEIEELGSGKLRAATVDGDIEYGSVMAGQISGLIKETLPVKVIIDEIINESKKYFRSEKY